MFSKTIYALSGPNVARPPLQDLGFLAYYIIVFSFIRQFLTIHVLRPLGHKLGVRTEGKLDRFAEQGYAIIYFSFFGGMGLVCRVYRAFHAIPSRIAHASCVFDLVCHEGAPHLVVQARARLAIIPPVGLSSRSQALLSPPILLLAATALGSHPSSRETPQRLL